MRKELQNVFHVYIGVSDHLAVKHEVFEEIRLT